MCTQRDCSLKNENSVINYSPSCRSAPVSAAPHTYVLQTDTENKKLLNKVVIFVFFAQKKVFS